MKWRTNAFMVTAILTAGHIQAQLNESDTARMQMRAGITGAWQQGNVQLLTLRSRLEMVSNGLKPWVAKTQNTLLYQEFGGRKADNDISSRNYLYFQPQKKLYPFAMVFVSTNYRRHISSRWFAGGGGTWQLIRHKNTTLKLSASMVYEQTRFKTRSYNEPAYNGSEQINIWRATGYISGLHHFFQQGMRFFYTAWCQPGFDDAHNLRWQLDAGIDFPVWKGLNATMVYAYTFEEVVPVTVKQVDRLLTFGVSYQYKKANNSSPKATKTD
jgi:hypothetical protein